MALPLTIEQEEYLTLLHDRYQDFRAAFTHVVKQDNDPAHVTLDEQPGFQLELQRAQEERLRRAVAEFLRVYPDGSTNQTPRLPATRGSINAGIPLP